MDSFRFDFRANNETPGHWRICNFQDDVVDLQAVADYLSSTYGYIVSLVVGHSRGGLVAFKWICTSEQGRNVEAFVNLASRYRMHLIRGNYTIHDSTFEKYGYYDWKVDVARKPVVGRIYPEDLTAFANWDTSFVWENFPQHTDVLTLHGLADETVPPYDAVIYARALTPRNPGSHTLCLLESANHNFQGHYDEVITTILEWLQLRGKQVLTSGLWKTGDKARL